MDARVAAAQLGGVHLLDRDVVLAGAVDDALDEVVALRSQRERAGLREDRLADGVGQFVPELVGAADEGHVGRPLGVGLADAAAVAVGRAEHVGRSEAVKADHPLSAPRQVPGGGRAHRSQSDDSDIVFVG